MLTPGSTPFNVYRIFEEDDFSGTTSDLAASYFDIDTPDPSIASGYKSHRLRGDALARLVGSGAPNQRPALWKEVRYMTRAEAGPGGGAVFEEIDFSTCCVFTTVIVEFYRETPTSATVVRGQKLVAEFDGGPSPACHIYRDANFTASDPLLPARWVKIEEARDFIPYNSVPTGYNWPADQHTSFYVGTPLAEQYFKRRAPGGPVPAAPVEGGDPTYWEPSSFTAIPPLGVSQASFDALDDRVALTEQGISDLRSDVGGVQTLVAALQSGKVDLWTPGQQLASRLYLLIGGIGTGLYQPKANYSNSTSVSTQYYDRKADFRFLPGQDVEALISALASRVTVLENTAPSGFDFEVSSWNAQTNTLPTLYALPESPLPAKGRFYVVSATTAPVTATTTQATSGDTYIYLSSTTGIGPGHAVTGTGIPAGCRVNQAFGNGSVELNKTVTVASGTVLTFTPSFAGITQFYAGDELFSNGQAWRIRPGRARVQAAATGAAPAADSVTEAMLAPAVRTKLNATGPSGPHAAPVLVGQDDDDDTLTVAPPANYRYAEIECSLDIVNVTPTTVTLSMVQANGNLVLDVGNFDRPAGSVGFRTRAGGGRAASAWVTNAAPFLARPSSPQPVNGLRFNSGVSNQFFTVPLPASADGYTVAFWAYKHSAWSTNYQWLATTRPGFEWYNTSNEFLPQFTLQGVAKNVGQQLRASMPVGVWRRIVLGVAGNVPALTATFLASSGQGEFMEDFSVRDFIAYTGQWTADELADPMAAPAANIVARFDLPSTQTGAVLPDTSGNGRNGTLYGF